MPYKEVPQGHVFLDSEMNLYYAISPLKDSNGNTVRSVFVDAMEPSISTSTLKPGDAAVLDPELSVEVY